jgi:hypothetical protein
MLEDYAYFCAIRLMNLLERVGDTVAERTLKITEFYNRYERVISTTLSWTRSNRDRDRATFTVLSELFKQLKAICFDRAISERLQFFNRLGTKWCISTYLRCLSGILQLLQRELRSWFSDNRLNCRLWSFRCSLGRGRNFLDA